MVLQGRRIAIFIADYYEDLEFWYPYFRMKEEGAEIEIIGPKIDRFTGKHGMSARSEKSIDDVRPDQFHALIIPGGYSPDHMRRSPRMVEFVKSMNKQGKLIAAICHAGWMLASADIIRGRKITSFHSIKDDMVNAGAEWLDQEVVVDGNVVTSRNPHDLPAFCRKIIEILAPTG